jgi:DNA helicase-2/ATP-dependent DNA helicase PcrA
MDSYSKVGMPSRPEYLPENLTDQQVDAILFRERPLLVIAGPGSGKTEVMSWRTVHLIKSGASKPENLLITTFTNKTALELKDRIQARLHEVNVELMQVSTLHSFCAWLLRRHPEASRLPENFRILDEDGQRLFVYANRRQLGLADIVKGRPADFLDDVIGLFNLSAEEMVAQDEFLRWCEGKRKECRECESALWQEQIAVCEAYRRYVDLLVSRRLTDFSHLQLFAVELLKQNPQIALELRSRFSDVLVDEYQDTNAAQVDILKRIVGTEGTGLAVVGDDDQSIYRFRGATVKNLHNFQKSFADAKLILLTQNFRSMEPIVSGTQRVIAHNPVRIEKALFTQRGIGNDILLIYEKDAAGEAEAVSGLLQTFHRQGKIRRWSDVAVLLRSVRSYAEPYGSAFAEKGIPFLLLGGGGFFEREEIAPLYNLLVRFLGAGKEWGDRFVREPVMGLDSSTLDALKEHKGNLLESASDPALRKIGVKNPGDRRKLLALLDLKQRVQSKKHSSLLAVFYELLSVTGCFAGWETEGRIETLENIGLFSRLIAAFDEFGGTKNYYPFQDYLQLLRDGKTEPVMEPPPDAVRIMTIHQAKGLEWPVVVLGSVMNGRLPATKRKPRYELPYALRASGSPEVEDPHLMDERKLFYVGATRARDLLVLSTADVVNKRGGGPSPFVEEMLGEDLHSAADLSRSKILEVESGGGEPAGPRPRFSFSQLAYYLQCPMRYKYAYEYGMAAVPSDPVDYGANVHRALREIHRRAAGEGNLGEDEAADIVARTWQVSPQADPEQDKKAQEAAVAQLRQYIRMHPSDLERVDQAEMDFSFAVDENVLSGKIDLVRREPDSRREIVDFKTSAALPIQLENIDIQLDLYALGAETQPGWTVGRQTVHFLKDDAVRSWEWLDPKKTEAHTGLSDLLNRINRREFDCRKEYCPRCAEFRGICPHGGENAEDESRPSRRE